MNEKIAKAIAEFLVPPRLFDAHISIITPYQWGKGWGDTPEEKRKQVLAAVMPMFLLDGWSVKKPSPFSGSAPEAFKGDERVYMHPMEFSGEMTEDTFEYLCESLRAVERDSNGLLRFNGGRIIEGLYADDDMYGFYVAHEDVFRDVIVDYIRERKTVSRYFLFDGVYCDSRIPTVKQHICLCSDEPQYNLLKTVFQHMLDDGTVIGTAKGYKLCKKRS